MSRLNRLWLRILPVAAALLACAATGCGEYDDASDGGADTCGDTSTGFDSDSDTAVDAGDLGRGDLADFPTDCLATCEEACAALDACGGAADPAYPMTLEECTALCTLAGPGAYWDDMSGNFRCCASQTDCAAVSGCGGWLDHGDLSGECEIMCGCMPGKGEIGALRSSRIPPEGYSWAPSTVVIERGEETADYGARYGAEIVYSGRYAVLRFKPSELEDYTAYLLEKHETVFPTFVDRGGHVAAATGDIVIEATDPAAASAAVDLVRVSSFKGVRELAWSKGRLRVAEGGDPWGSLDTLQELNAIPGVRAELDMLRLYEKRMTPNDPLFHDQWHLQNDGQGDPESVGGPTLSVVGVDGRVSEAWDVTTGSPETIIAVLDDGVNVLHPDLAPNALEPYNYPEDWEGFFEGTPYLDALGGHGTECAGVAAARGNNGIGVSGVCPNCSLLPALLWDQAQGKEGLPTGGSFMASDAAMAQMFTDIVDRGAAVISCSWGIGGEDPNVESDPTAWPSLPTVTADAFDYAETDGRHGRGTVITFAAGNSNEDITNDPYTSHAGIVGVAAVDDQGLKPYYSSWGATVDIGAPSNGGKNGITTVATSSEAATDPQYDYDFGGTSSACPFAAGVFGLVFSANPDLTAAQARQIVADSATKIDPVWGGWADGFSPYYGAGLVNAYRAVRMAEGTCSDPEACLPPSDAAEADGGACAICRTDNDCADGFACQALPELGAQMCVEKVETTTCPTDFTYANGYCLPTRTACGLCGTELCNSRDDDCDGTIDEDLADCDITPRCMQDGFGCPEGTACAATVCMDGCTDASDCVDESGEVTGAACIHVKTRYGTIDEALSVCGGGSFDCGDICTVLVSSLVDEEMQAFVDCINGAGDCNAVWNCMSLLPVGK
jgi:subtilisin family serine protease